MPERRSADLTELLCLDPSRCLIVIPCSAKKASGGHATDARPAWPPELIRARASLAGRAGLDETRLLPAWRRYTGSFYRVASTPIKHAASDAHLVILSGGYGLLEAAEMIGSYNRILHLGDWPNGLLSRLLNEEAIRRDCPTLVGFAGFSTAYARVIRHAGRAAALTDAFLVGVDFTGGSALIRAPQLLGRAFAAFWERLPGNEYPVETRVVTLR
jgi:hypothetical protein